MPCSLSKQKNLKAVQNQCIVSSNFSLPCRAIVHSSASGLLFLSSITAPDDLFLCNPLTRECIKLPPCPTIETYRDVAYELKHHLKAFGFGVSKLTGRYKVVKIFYARWIYPQAIPCKCEVYTLGTGRWRRVSTGGKLWCAEPMSLVVSLNGNLHWLVSKDPRSYDAKRILYFDLETECFKTFALRESPYFIGSIFALRGSLCWCETSSYGFDIWLMKEYGDDQSWTKEFVIKKQHSYELSGVNVPIKVLLDGDLLFVNQFSSKLYCYSSKTNTIREIHGAESLVKDGARPADYTPSFLPLITYVMQNVSSS